MGSPTFGMPTSGNNAPLPMFGSFTNPTGGTSGKGMPGASWPMFGSPSSGLVSPTANMPAFGGTNDPMTALNSGFNFGNNWQDAANRFGKAYGKGPGQLIYNMLSQGLFNPKTAEAFLNAMQPGIARGEANLLQSFGAEGSRFGSAAALGMGDYLSQVNLNEQSTLASMYMQAQSEQLALLENTLPTLHQERADEGSFLEKFLGFQEIMGGMLGISPGGIQGGNSLLFGNNSPIPNGGNTGTFGMGAPSWSGGQATFSSGPYNNQTNPVPNSTLLDSSAGGILGGNDPFSGGGALSLLYGI